MKKLFLITGLIASVSGQTSTNTLSIIKSTANVAGYDNIYASGSANNGKSQFIIDCSAGNSLLKYRPQGTSGAGNVISLNSALCVAIATQILNDDSLSYQSIFFEIDIVAKKITSFQIKY